MPKATSHDIQSLLRVKGRYACDTGLQQAWLHATKWATLESLNILDKALPGLLPLPHSATRVVVKLPVML